MRLQHPTRIASRSRSIGLSSARKRSASEVAVSCITILNIDKASCGLFYYNYYRGIMTRPAAERAFSLGVIILAAGRSARMGKPKLLLPWGKTSVLGHLIEQWRALGADQIAVVCAPGDVAVRAELDRLGVLEGNRIGNPAPERGMFSSVQ